MENRLLTELVSRQAEITLYNTQAVLATCLPDDELAGLPVWQVLYTALHRLDCGLIPAGDLRRDPDFHRPELTDPAVPFPGKPLSKEQLAEYYLDVKARLFLLLDELDDELLLRPAARGADTLLDVILSELRLFTYEIGRINTMTMLRTGKKPLFFNDDRHYPADHRYFEAK